MTRINILSIILTLWLGISIFNSIHEMKYRKKNSEAYTRSLDAAKRKCEAEEKRILLEIDAKY